MAFTMMAFTMRPFYYVAANGFGSLCGLTVLRDIARTYPKMTMVILSEPMDNHGPSITNNVEIIIARVAELLALEHKHMLWIEHYPAGAWGGPNREEFDCLIVNPDDPTDLDWQPITGSDWPAMSSAAGRFPWGHAPPKLVIPPELRKRFDGVCPGDIFPFKAKVIESELALVAALAPPRQT